MDHSRGRSVTTENLLEELNTEKWYTHNYPLPKKRKICGSIHENIWMGMVCDWS
jgi:hypothetical protein